MTSPIESVLAAKPRDLGGFSVRRLLPAAQRRSVGPYVFLDHLGPAIMPPGEGLSVRPHPHIGLATVTWLYDGALVHRDSLGFVQTILPGAVNWMTAGRGIVHSERTPDRERAAGHRIEAVQTWVALPKRYEEAAPSFVHYPAETLPKLSLGSAQGVLIAGEGWGQRSPVVFPSEICQAAFECEADAEVDTPPIAECCVLVVRGRASIEGAVIEEGQLAVLVNGRQARVKLAPGARIMLAGGDPLDGPRRLDWNFVATSTELVHAARDDWRAAIANGFSDGRFRLPPGETRWTPYPGDAQPVPEDAPPRD
jgi:redox-sensitive bicupin YhaK (pirin superfamily)